MMLHIYKKMTLCLQSIAFIFLLSLFVNYAESRSFKKKDVVYMKTFIRTIKRSDNIGNKFNPAHNCQEIFTSDPDAKSGVYWLVIGKEKFKVQMYCQKKEKNETDEEEDLPQNLSAGKPIAPPFDWEELHRESWPRPIDPPTEEEMNQKIQKALTEYKAERQNRKGKQQDTNSEESKFRSNVTVVHLPNLSVSFAKKSETGTVDRTSESGNNTLALPDSISAEEANTTLAFKINNETQSYALQGNDQFGNFTLNQTELSVKREDPKTHQHQQSTNIAYIKFSNGGVSRSSLDQKSDINNTIGSESADSAASGNELMSTNRVEDQDHTAASNQSILGNEQEIDNEDAAAEAKIENPDDLAPGNIWPPQLKLMIGQAFNDYKSQKDYADGHGGPQSVFSQLKGDSDEKGSEQKEEEQFSGSAMQDEITSEQINRKLNSIPYAKYLD